MVLRTAWLCLGLLVSTASLADVPIKSFAKRPDYYDVKISPQGDYIALLVPDGDGQTGIAVLSLSPAKILSKISLGDHRSASQYWWVSPNRLVVTPALEYGTLEQPFGTGELFAFDADGKNQKYLFGYQGADETGTLIHQVTKTYGAASILRTLPDDPDHAIIEVSSAYNSVDSGHIESYRLNVNSGFLDHRDASPVPGYSNLLTDRKGELRFASDSRNFEDIQMYFRPVASGEWVLMNAGDLKNTQIEPLGFSRDNTKVFLRADNGAGSDCLVEKDLASGADTTLKCATGSGLGAVEFSFDGSEPIATRYFSDKPVIAPLDRKSPDQIKLLSLAASFPGMSVQPVSHTTDGSKVVVYVRSDRDPGGYYLFQPKPMRADPLLAVRNWIDPTQMAVQKAVFYKTRDGQSIQGFLTLPNGVPAKNLPMVTLPHGGPFGIADSWGWNPDAQLLASRGYAVLQVNFRGSGGYGEAFVQAGRNGWDSVMINDITDGTRWAIEQGIADPKRLCIFGGSYGGYAAVMSAVREPDLYKCVVGYAGVYDLEKWKRDSDVGDSIRGRTYISDFVGATPERLRAASPLQYINNLKASIMIVHGEEDERVPFNQAKALRSALEARHYPYEWLAKSGEGHGFYKEENRIELYEKLLAFLDKNIGKSSVSAVPPVPQSALK
jgi:dipeptidyl aminopeptidase/acylaminoacyl peptidase